MYFAKPAKIALLLASAILLNACGAETLYSWNGYDYAILKHYKDGTSSEEFASSLKEIIDKAEKKGNVPPGVYAEYAFAMYDSGEVDTAIIYFDKERIAWPESEVFMSGVIRRLGGGNS